MFALIVPNEGVQSGVDTLTPRENAQVAGFLSFPPRFVDTAAGL